MNRFLIFGVFLVLASYGQKRIFWSFKPVAKTDVPVIEGASNPIDAFVLSKLRSKGLDFAPPADHRTLIRRLSFDLTGLPPTIEELKLSYDESIGRLLASPRYGERWGRHWLDVVRFGETDGGEHNYERPHAWRYRDYVIDAFNSDKPYNLFVREQIAGDLLRPNDPKMVAATGFLVAGPWDQVQAEINKDKAMAMTQRMDELDDMVTTVAHTFLGVTANCARCHDHKFDPIPAKDYYRLTAVFSGVGFGNRQVADPAAKTEYEARVAPLKKQLDEVKAKIIAVEEPVRARLLEPRLRAFDQARRKEPQRLPLNSYYNHNWFAPVTAKQFRFVMQPGKIAPKIKWFQAGSVRLAEQDGLSLTLPGGTIREIEWAGTPLVYEFQASDDGINWRTICSSLDHVGRNELDLPAVTDAELESTPGRRELLAERTRVETAVASIPAPPLVYAAKPRPQMDKAFLLDRGSVTKPVAEVTPGALSAVSSLPPDLADGSSGDAARRFALADWITDPKNPLTARVIVNRVWFYHFGNGIVNTPSDFGLMGDRPSHPEQLDWLATEFVEHNWSVKWLHRLILSSQTYRQSSQFNEKAHAIDGANRLLWHMPLKRMDAETIRDSILVASGKLNLDGSGGPGFELQKKGSRGSFIYKVVDNDGPEVWRRGVFRFVVRGGERIMLDSFDCPDPAVATPQRAISNTPVQALTLFNNDFVIRQAGYLAERAGSVEKLYEILFQRSPTQREAKLSDEFLQRESLSALVRVLLNSNEFVYVP